MSQAMQALWESAPQAVQTTGAPFLPSAATEQDRTRLEMSRERDNVWKPNMKTRGLLEDAPYK